MSQPSRKPVTLDGELIENWRDLFDELAFLGREEQAANSYHVDASNLCKSPPLLVIDQEESGTPLNCQDDCLCLTRINEQSQGLKIFGWLGFHTDEPLQAHRFKKSKGAWTALRNSELVENTRRDQDLSIEIFEKV